MSAESPPPPPEQEKEPERTPTERESEEPKYSIWGVASFAIIFIIFALTIVATLSRDFIPGGMTSPV